MTRYAFSIDLDRCIGCQACVVACKIGNEIPEGDHYITIGESVRGQMPDLVGTFVHHRCLHCGDAACVEVCPTGTLSKWNGLTTVDATKCSACGYCTDACPFHVPNIVDNHVSKCAGCFDRVKDGETPWCARTCPSQAIRFGERDQIVADAKARLAAVLPRFPNASLYGEAALGGLGVVSLLLDKPAIYGLPENPTKPALIDVWQQVVQPASVGLSLAALLATGLSFIIARRQHAFERAHGHAPADASKGEEEKGNG